jgi:hypothetical protein
LEGFRFGVQRILEPLLVEFALKLTGENWVQFLICDLSFFDSIGKVEANWLERVFEEGEVFEMVKALNNDKASVALTVTLWHSSLLGCFKRRYNECFP